MNGWPWKKEQDVQWANLKTATNGFEGKNIHTFRPCIIYQDRSPLRLVVRVYILLSGWWYVCTVIDRVRPNPANSTVAVRVNMAVSRMARRHAPKWQWLALPAWLVGSTCSWNVHCRSPPVTDSLIYCIQESEMIFTIQNNPQLTKSKISLKTVSLLILTWPFSLVCYQKLKRNKIFSNSLPTWFAGWNSVLHDVIFSNKPTWLCPNLPRVATFNVNYPTVCLLLFLLDVNKKFNDINLIIQDSDVTFAQQDNGVVCLKKKKQHALP